MKMRIWKRGLALSCGLLAVSANAATPEKRADKPFADADHVVYTLPSGSPGLPLKSLLTNHGGGVLAQAKVVFIFWGPNFANAASPDHTYATTLQMFRNQFGSTPNYRVVQQYGITWPTNLGSGTADWFDTTTPPTNVTDTTVQAEVNRYFSGGHGTYNSSTIYEVVIPSGHYSSSGSSTSCGGPALSYCTYHGHYSGTAGTVIYSIQPYPSCSGCKVSGWSDVQNEEHFVCYSTANAVTDPVNGWWDDATGQEVADKCAGNPPVLGTGSTGGCSLWSNALGRCVNP
jgi:hypothetical protein